MLSRKGLSEGVKPRSRGLLGRAGVSAPAIPAGKTACGCIRDGNVSDTFREGKTPKGRIPGALPARNKAGTGSEGVSCQEGNQTLKAERSGAWKLRGRWTSEP